MWTTNAAPELKSKLCFTRNSVDNVTVAHSELVFENAEDTYYDSSYRSAHSSGMTTTDKFKGLMGLCCVTKLGWFDQVRHFTLQQ